jgi:hypothetical protein
MNLKLIIAALVGVAIGAAGAAAIHAQAKVAPGYVVAEIEITDAAKFQEYAAQVATSRRWKANRRSGRR